MKTAPSISRKIALGFGLALVLSMILGLVSYRNTVRFVDSAAVVARTHRTISLLQAVLADVVSAESEARGYVITGEERFLHLYQSAVTDAGTDLRELRELVRDPTNRQRLGELDRLMQDRMARLRATVETRRLEGLEAVQESAGPGKKLMDDLRRVAAEIEDRQHLLLKERDEDARSIARRTRVMVLVTGALATLVATAGAVLITADVAHRERLEKEVLEISEREQRRIGQDLHDGVCQQLTGVSLLSHSLQQQLEGPPANDAGRVTGLINECLEQTRRVTRGLHPVPDEPTGLQLALEELAQQVCATARLACRFTCPEPVPLPDQIAATNLYRIAQEAVQNALKHAGATALEIGLHADEAAITMTVRDDGCGLPEPRSRKGLGIEIMHYRAHNIGASLHLEWRRAGGTTVVCTLPRKALRLPETPA